MISQCPNCKTRFVVSEAKLDIAAGNVRCGACMQVFCASSNQLADQRKNIDDQAVEQSTEEIIDHSSMSASDITHDWLNDLLPESDTDNGDKERDNALDNDRIEPSIDSMASLETPPVIEIAATKVPAIEIALSAKRSLKNRLLNLIGLSLCFTLILTISAYWILAHPHYFKGHPHLKDIYHLVCQLQGCQQPKTENIFQIRSFRMTSHPEQANTLLLETVILNTAKRRQLFPEIEVHLNDLNGKPLAQHHFIAADYLHGELQGRKYLPPATPVHVSLVIKNAEPAAVNYAIQLNSIVR